MSGKSGFLPKIKHRINVTNRTPGHRTGDKTVSPEGQEEAIVRMLLILDRWFDMTSITQKPESSN